MSKFINPFTDIGFKRIFGQEISKPVLITFLNALLADERKIVDVKFLSRSIVAQGERGSEWNYDIKAVYLVAFLNFKLSDISEDFRTDVALMDMKLRTVFSDKVRLIFSFRISRRRPMTVRMY